MGGGGEKEVRVEGWEKQRGGCRRKKEGWV